MINIAIVGASGYAGSELVRLLCRHKDVNLTHVFVSENSQDVNCNLSSLYGALNNMCHHDLILEPLTNERLITLSNADCDAIFLATDHKVSHDIAPILIDNGIVVIDLSGAFRIKDSEKFAQYYGFTLGPKQQELMHERVYALVDFLKDDDLQKARLISMPGCYPTASQLALRPLIEHDILDLTMPPVINAISGVSGAGRKASLTNSFCEVSLNAYNLFKHRHLIEIEEQLGTKLIFNPHLANFTRGILATITCKVKNNISDEQILKVYQDSYLSSKVKSGEKKGIDALEQVHSLVRICNAVKLANVQNLPYCDLSFVRDGDYIVICSAIDNLLKGAASQAIEAMNMHFGLPRARSLI